MSAEAEKLLDQFRQLPTNDFNPRVLCDELREQEKHMEADVIESLSDQLVETHKKLDYANTELRLYRRRPSRRKRR